MRPPVTSAVGFSWLPSVWEVSGVREVSGVWAFACVWALLLVMAGLALGGEPRGAGSLEPLGEFDQPVVAHPFHASHPAHTPPSFPRGTFEEAAAARWDHSYSSVVNGRFWAGGEFLGWAMKGANLPALVTTGPNAMPEDLAGRLGRDGKTVLFGDDEIHNELRPGGRVRGGFWWTPDHLTGFEGSYFGVDGHKVSHRSIGDGDLILARPYRDAMTGEQAALLTAYPGLLDGVIDITADLEFSGAEALWRHVLFREGYRQVELFAGYRYLYLSDKLQTRETMFSLDAASGFPVDTLIDRTDLFEAANQFHGGEVGLQATWKGNYGLSLVALSKLAVGTTSVAFDVDGATVVSEDHGDGLFETTAEYDGGLLTQPTNIGRHETSEFASVVEVGLSLEYELNRDVRLQVGYTLIYWSQVARALEHVDTTVNPTQIQGGTLDGPARPTFEFSLDDFWAQGIRGGVEIDF